MSLIFALGRQLPASDALAYLALQILGGIIATILAHAMFELPLVQLSATARTRSGQ